uniref:lytic murein transglycosylase n=1 Tax=Nitrosomonas sp. TaxID=42353 RepID=UPI00261B2BB0
MHALALSCPPKIKLALLDISYGRLFSGILVFSSWLLMHDVYADSSHFNECISRIGAQAKTEGISDKTVQQVLGKVKHNQRVIELDRRQPEFTQTFANYFNTRINDERVQRGRELLAKHRGLLNQIQQESGIPAQYLVSFWGLETSYG